MIVTGLNCIQSIHSISHNQLHNLSSITSTGLCMMSQDDKSDKSDDCMLEQSASKTLSNKVTHDSSLSPSTSWMLSMCCCFKDPSDKQAAYIIFASVLHFLAIGLTSVALKLLINKRCLCPIRGLYHVNIYT